MPLPAQTLGRIGQDAGRAQMIGFDGVEIALPGAVNDAIDPIGQRQIAQPGVFRQRLALSIVFAQEMTLPIIDEVAGCGAALFEYPFAQAVVFVAGEGSALEELGEPSTAVMGVLAGKIEQAVARSVVGDGQGIEALEPVTVGGVLVGRDLAVLAAGQPIAVRVVAIAFAVSRALVAGEPSGGIVAELLASGRIGRGQGSELSSSVIGDESGCTHEGVACDASGRVVGALVAEAIGDIPIKLQSIRLRLVA